MITGVVAIRIMTEYRRCPAVGGMAHITLLSSVQMVDRFRRAASVRYMATVTVASGTGIMYPYTTDESGGGVAVVTIQRGIEVDRVDLGIFTLRGDSIMAGSAVIHDTTVVEGGTLECGSRVAGTTVLIRYQVRAVFTDSERTIMAGDTVIHDTSVIESAGDESCGLMTDAAVLIGRHMVRWWCLAARDGAIVTGGATIDDVGMIETCTGESRRVMTE